ncbi:MAG: GGDEF domain-containing protein [Lachnospiraceae bacterium]|nr:GGDEF domain-containing protein [Lachnospiraceae bacterium]
MAERRKRIALFAAYPEIVHVRRIVDGISQQCRKYNYDLCVFASSTHLSFPHPNYVRGEANIYELADLDSLDGVILDHATLTGDPEDKTLQRLLERLRKHPSLPCCSLEVPLEGIKYIRNDNEEVLREMCRHAIEKHGRKKLCILTGHKDHPVSEERLRIFLDEIHAHGLDVAPEHIYYGDFWYYGGDTLARKIVSKEISMPDAVICASDCMAIGVIDRLVKNGIRVPEDVLVIGFDASDEAAIHTIPVTSYDPNDVGMASEAVDYLRSVLEPEAELLPLEQNMALQFHPGASCGCQSDPIHAMKRFRNSLYVNSYNQADEDLGRGPSIGDLMESYALEDFTAAGSTEECLDKLVHHSFMLTPYRNFHLCLKENWLDMSDVIYEGYPQSMRILLSLQPGEGGNIRGTGDGVSFATKEMLPKLNEERDEASVFYFSPIHFDGVLLGYTVLQRAFNEHPCIETVYRNWLRFINNALEMIRSKERLKTISVRDEMTGAYNRRGMYERYRAMRAEAKPGDSLLVCVADMDGLKYINDTFGHHEGDLGIRTVYSVLNEQTRGNEFCVRSGGDEFFLIGIGKYTKDDEATRAVEFTDAMAKRSEAMSKPYSLSASIGCVVFEDLTKTDLDAALSLADEKMYNYKFRHRRHRSV